MDESAPIFMHPADELERLVRFMTRKGRRFGLALATCADEALARDVREQVIRRATAAGQVVEIVGLWALESDAVAQLAGRSQHCDVVFVLGLDVIAYDIEDRSVEVRVLSELNIQRDDLPQHVRARVVFWISAVAYPKLARIAWDLLDVMVARFRFDPAGERRRIPARRALLLGASISSFPSVLPDIDLMSDVLAPSGWHIHRVVPATRTRILEAFQSLARSAGPDDALLVYFSGIGGLVLDPALGEQRSLVTSDLGGRPKRNWVVSPISSGPRSSSV
ncbi:MAG: caspase family protein [Deltaproteobacteria bacterium]|nr:caspase family protein [Deltaproteobacteria bacterium]